MHALLNDLSKNYWLIIKKVMNKKIEMKKEKISH